MGFPPEAFLIGAQKAGTTSLAFLLAQHPQITVSSPKEPDFFTRHYGKGLSWYRSCFKDPSRAVCLDASTSYSMVPLHSPSGLADPDPRLGVAGRIHGARPDAKLIYLLRDPVSRAYSSYWHSVRNGEERRSFREAISDDDSDYLLGSDYYGQVKNYLTHFSLESFCFLSFRELTKSPHAVARKCLDFLSLDTGFEPDLQRARNPSYTYSGIGKIAARVLASSEGLQAAYAAVRSLLPKKIETMVRGLATNPIPEIEDIDRDFLEDYFYGRNLEFERLTGIRVSEC